MSDWELTSLAPTSPNKKINQKSQSDWVLSEPMQKESLGQAAMYAVPRVGLDLLNSAYQGAQNLPQYWEQAKTEVPGFLNPMNWALHPLERGKQSLAGLLELGQKLNRAPHDIAQYAANRLNLIPEQWAQNIPVAPSLDPAIEKYLGNPTHPGEALARGLGRNADLLTGVNALGKALPHLTKRGATKTLNKAQKLAREREIGNLNVNPELIEDARQFLPDLLQNRDLIKKAYGANKSKIPLEKYESGDQFGVSHNSGNTELPTNTIGLMKNGNTARVIHSVVEEKHRGKGIGKALYKEAIEDTHKKGFDFESDSVISNDAMNVYKALEKEGYKFKFNPHAKEVNGKYLGEPYKRFESPDDSPVVKLISKPQPKVGDYNSLFKLQSDVGKISSARTGKIKSLFAPETHLKGVAGLESRNNLLNAIHENLQGMGHKDISDLLRKGQNEYRRYMKFRKYRNIIGGAAVAYAAPKNPLTDLVKKIWRE